MIYKITISEKHSLNLDSLDFSAIKHRFLYDSLSQDIKISGDLNRSHYLFFDAICAQVASASTKEEFDDVQLQTIPENEYSDTYHAYYFDTELSDEEISQHLRASDTLVIDESNSFETKNMKIVFAEKGFVFCSKRDDRDLTDTFERVLFLFLLAASYNAYSEVLINKMTKSFSEENFKKMIEIRDDIYSFDLRCFFHNPVKINRHETFNLWHLIASNYYVKVKYDEMKSQITDLANIIEIKQQKIQEAKNRKFEKLVAIVGIVLAATSLVGFYLDLQELGVLG